MRVPFKCLKLLECKYDTKSGSAKTQAPQQPALSLSLYIYICKNIYRCVCMIQVLGHVAVPLKSVSLRSVEIVQKAWGELH